jgi:hypothetical protein
MSRLLLAVATALCWTPPFTDTASASTNAVTHFDRTILKEPAYQSTPKYCLLTFGNKGDVKVWMIEDGKRLFVDKNANGDLTDDGPPIMPSNLLDRGNNQWAFQYKLDSITPTNGSRHTSFVLRRWNSAEKEDSYGLSISVDGRMPMYAGWFGTFWSTNREQAPVIHFGGPFTPKLIRRKHFTVGETGQWLSLRFQNPGSGPGAESMLSIDAIPTGIVPRLNIEWPTASGSPLRMSYELNGRCCYWEFHKTDFELPKGVVPGVAKVFVDLPTSYYTPIELTTTEIEEPIVAPSAEPNTVH